MDFIPTIKDLDERIDVNLNKGLTLKQIEDDTIVLMRDFEATVINCQMQIYIYKLLLDRIKQRGK